MEKSTSYLFLFLISLLLSCTDVNESQPASNTLSGPPNGSGTYEEMVALYQEFRKFQRPDTINGIEDYSAATMNKRIARLDDYRDQLWEMGVADWPIPQQVDFLAVRSQIDQYDFQLRVSRPWARDPGFYVDRLLRLTFTDLPASGDKLEQLISRLKNIPPLLTAAKTNLNEVAADYAALALHNLENSDGVGHGHPFRDPPPAGVIGWYDDLLGRAAKDQPDIVPLVEEAQKAVVSFRDWLTSNQNQMTDLAGVGAENYDWFLKYVKMMPYSTSDLQALGKREYERLNSFLALERHKNRDLPELEISKDGEEYQRRIDEADRHIRNFTTDNAILTIPDYVGELETNAPWIVRPEGPNFWEQIQFRDPSPDHVHAVIPGHRFDFVLAGKDDHPIRSTYWDGGRVEGWGFYLEEMMLQTGLLDERPRTKELFHIFGIKRATRVYVDVMMQCNEMTVEEATQYMMDRVPYLNRDVARVDAEIYLRRPPGYGISYTIGKLQMDKLLADSYRQKGNDFKLGKFHDEFLSLGRIPVSLIRYQMTGLDDEVKQLWEWEPIP
jgi:hypothetical protein